MGVASASSGMPSTWPSAVKPPSTPCRRRHSFLPVRLPRWNNRHMSTIAERLLAGQPTMSLTGKPPSDSSSRTTTARGSTTRRSPTRASTTPASAPTSIGPPRVPPLTTALSTVGHHRAGSPGLHHRDRRGPLRAQPYESAPDGADQHRHDPCPAGSRRPAHWALIAGRLPPRFARHADLPLAFIALNGDRSCMRMPLAHAAASLTEEAHCHPDQDHHKAGSLKSGPCVPLIAGRQKQVPEGGSGWCWFLRWRARAP